MLGHLRESDCSLTSYHPSAEPCACSVPFTGEKPNFPAAKRTVLQWFCYLVYWHFPYSPVLDPPPGSQPCFCGHFYASDLGIPDLLEIPSNKSVLWSLLDFRLATLKLS